MSSEMQYSDEQISNLLNGIFAGTITEYEIPLDLYVATADYLKKGLYQGFGGSLVDFDGKDLELLTELRENIYMFSAAKNFTEIREFRSLLFDENDQRRTLREFLQHGEQSYERFNSDWGRTEYATAEGQAQMASKWQEIERNKDILSVLMYDARGDACPICLPLNGLTAPVNDPIWRTKSPLNHFNCFCVLTQHEADEVKLTPEKEVRRIDKEVDAKMDNIFKMNPGIDRYVFSPDHPYFQVEPKDKAYAANNFNLPIPKTDKPIIPFELNESNIEKLKQIGFSEIDKSAYNKSMKGFDLVDFDKRIQSIFDENKINITKKYLSNNGMSNDAVLSYVGDFNGEKFKMNRIFKEKNGLKSVFHEELLIPKDLQGKGIGRQLIKESYSEYKKINIEKIELHAGHEVGGYAWGKFGFNAKYSQLEKLNEHIYQQTSNGSITFGENMKISKYLNGVKEGENINMFEIANMPFGKRLLLGSDWAGELNLTDNFSKTVFENYLKK